MSDILVAVLGGVFTYLITTYVFDPLRDLLKLLAEISHSLTYYANAYPDLDPKRAEEARYTIRSQAGLLLAKTHIIPLYNLWARLWPSKLPTEQGIQDAYSELIGLSNRSSRDTDFTERSRRIAKGLCLRPILLKLGDPKEVTQGNMNPVVHQIKDDMMQKRLGQLESEAVQDDEVDDLRSSASGKKHE